MLYHVDVGERVSKRQCPTVIVSNAGRTRHEVLSPVDGFVMTRRDRQFVRRGEDVINLLRTRFHDCCVSLIISKRSDQENRRLQIRSRRGHSQ